MARLTALALALAACAPALTPPAPRAVLSEIELRAWTGYLASVERLLAQPEERQSGLVVLEARAKLAEHLSGVGALLSGAMRARAGRLVSALDERFERIARREGPPAPAAAEAPRAAAEPPPTPAPPTAPQLEPQAELSAEERDDGGPPVDIVLPPAPPTAWLRWPVSPVRVTSGYGYRRDPITGRVGFHDGLDLSVPKGSLVVAAGGGRVAFAGRRGGAGNVVVIAHAPGVKTAYAHLHKILATAGAAVRAGDPLGLVGSTGRSTGPHLHFVVRMGGRAVNPMFVVGQERVALR
jgi:murein DD-endopeptidase MepM/ murein hydrolase activator NlpD